MSNQALETYETLRDKILSGEFRPTQQLNTSQLVKALGVSRDHIRMAFQRLDVEGLIELRPNQGAVVCDVTLEDTLDLFVVREALEAEAYRRAFFRIDDEGIHQLEALVQQMRQAISDKDFELYSNAALNFREIVLENAGSPHLRKITSKELLMTKIRLRKVIIPLRGQSSLAEHENIITAFKEGNVEAVVESLRTHLSNVKEDIERYWDIIKP